MLHQILRGPRSSNAFKHGQLRIYQIGVRTNFRVASRLNRSARNRAIVRCQCTTSPTSWNEVVDLHKSGVVWTGKIDSVNRGGAIVNINGIEGFIPFKNLDQARLPANRTKSKKFLVGQTLKAKIVEINEDSQKCVLSESQYLQEEGVKQLEVGDRVDVVVTGITDFGVFVSVKGKKGAGVFGLIHISELSWDRVLTPDAVVSVGDEFPVVVATVDQDSKRVAFSLRQAQQDPLTENLDNLLPLDESAAQSDSKSPESVWEYGGNPLPGLDYIVQELSAEEGVEGVELGRQALESRIVSQDLELWLSKEEVSDGYNVVARAGKMLQELHVTTSLSRDAMKGALSKVLKRVI